MTTILGLVLSIFFVVVVAVVVNRSTAKDVRVKSGIRAALLELPAERDIELGENIAVSQTFLLYLLS